MHASRDGTSYDETKQALSQSGGTTDRMADVHRNEYFAEGQSEEAEAYQYTTEADARRR